MGLAAAFVAVAFPVAVFAAPGDVGPWQIDDVVSDNLAWTSAQAYNGYLYLVSGANDSVYTDTIYYAQLAGNGSIGPWATTANAPYSGSSISVTTYNGYMYYISGWNGVDITNDAYYAVINPDGTISNWTATTSTPDAWSGAAITAYNGYVYMLGGDNGSGYDDSVIFAPINPDGSLGSWTSTTLLPVALSGGGVLAYNDHIYYVGGSDGFRVATVYYAALNPDGTVGSWQTTTALPDERGDGGLVVHNGYLFLVGGYNDLGITNTVLAAPINANGTVGAWSTKSPMPDERALAGVASYNGFVYNLAGLDDSSLTNTAFYAALSGYDLPAVQPVSAIAATSTAQPLTYLKTLPAIPTPTP